MTLGLVALDISALVGARGLEAGAGTLGALTAARGDLAAAARAAPGGAGAAGALARAVGGGGDGDGGTGGALRAALGLLEGRVAAWEAAAEASRAEAQADLDALHGRAAQEALEQEARHKRELRDALRGG